MMEMTGRYGAFFSGSHDEHDPVWQLQTGPQSAVCIVCILEILEDPEALVIKKCAFLSHFTNLLKTQYREPLMEMLLVDDKIAASLLTTILQLLSSENENLTEMAVDTAAQLCCLLKSDDIAYFVLEQVSTHIIQLGSFQNTLPAFVLLGRLLHGIPPLSQKLADNMDLLDYLATGLDYPDRKIKSAILFVLAKVCTSADNVEYSGWLGYMREITPPLLSILVKEEVTDVLVNGMGLLLVLLEHPETIRVLVPEFSGLLEQDVGGRATLCSSLRKMVMASDTAIQVAGVRAVSTILQHILDGNLDPAYANYLLNGDVAEFQFEALATTNEQLLDAIFQSLLMFADFDAFFKKGHTLYGIDAVVRGVHQSLKSASTAVQCCGFQLLAKILSNQSSNTSLLSNSAGYQQFVQLFVSGLQTCNADLVIDVFPALSAFLRRDHQPSPVPYADLQNVLALVVSNLKGWPAMQCCPVSDVQVKAKSRELEGNSRPSKAQRLLEEGLEVFYHACNLAAVCKEDPLADESIFAPPGSQSSDGSGRSSSSKVDSFLQFLFQQTDDIFIPLVMQNLQSITEREIFGHIFSILNLLYQLIPDAMRVLSFKLVSSSFLRLSLEVKAKFCTGESTDKLQHAANLFIKEQLLVLLMTRTEKKLSCSVVEEEDFIVKDFLSILAHINGEPQSLLTLIMEKSDLENTDKECLVHKVQKGCLAILYYSYLHNDRMVDELSLYKALLVCMDQEPLPMFPLYTIKHLLFLLAVSSPMSDTNQVCTLALIQVLAAVKEPFMVYTHHHVLLEWCFRSSELAKVIGAVFLGAWLQNNLEPTDTTMHGTVVCQTHGAEEMEFLKMLLLKNTTAVSTLMDLIGNGGGREVMQALEILESIVFSKSADENPCFETLLSYRLPNILHQLLASYKHETDHTIAAVLRIVCHCYLYDHIRTRSDGLDLKLVHQVLNTLTRHAISGEVLLASLNYLFVLLVGTSARKDTRLLAILLSNDAVLVLLQELVSGTIFRQDTISEDQAVSLQSCTLQLFGALVNLQAQFKVTCDYSVLIHTESTCDMLSCDRPLLQLFCVVTFLSSMFHVSFQSPVVRLDLAISPRHLQLIFLSLQNILVIEEEMLRNAVVRCISRLLAYIKETDQTLLNHLLSQPWNHVLLQTVIDIQNSAMVPASLVTLLTLYLEHGSQGLITQKLVDRVLREVVLTDFSQNGTSRIVQYERFVSTVVKCSDLKMSSTQKVSLKKFVQKISKEQAVGSLEETLPKFVEVHGVVLCWVDDVFQLGPNIPELSALLEDEDQFVGKSSIEC